MMVKRDRPAKPVIAYVRVSTREQSKSGLGLEAQQAALEQFAKREVFEIAETFVEVASGASTKRPKLDAAIKAARRLKDEDYGRAPILVAKLDRSAVSGTKRPLHVFALG
jgi:DNA invertase Pin-like site-specific DNA recombinase